MAVSICICSQWCQKDPLRWLLVKALIYEYGRMLLGVILLIFFVEFHCIPGYSPFLFYQHPRFSSIVHLDWTLHRMLSMELFAFFYMQTYDLTSIICWKCCPCFFTKKKSSVHRCLDLFIYFWGVFNFIPLNKVFVFYDNTMWFLLL